MERVTSIEEVRQTLAEPRREGKTVALVPTMGALHEGHLSLVRAARARADVLAVSIFVNPLQFGPDEDYTSYPRDMARDIELLDAEEVDVVFTPSVEEMYPPRTDTVIEPGIVSTLWEGEHRPGHFTGVCTVVAKLFNVVTPDVAFFGEKDYQQLVILRRMVRDLDFGVQVTGVPIIRERGGLALSSRNVRLTPEQRSAARVLSHTLEEVRAQVAAGERDAVTMARFMAEEIEGETLAELDYAAIVDPETLEPLARLDGPGRALVAARFGRTRLIDNAPLVPPSALLSFEAAGEAECQTSPV